MRFRRHEGQPLLQPMFETIAGRRLVLQVAVVLGAFLLGYLLTVIWLFPSKLFSTDHAVPRLLDLGVTEAKSRLTKAGFRMKLDPDMAHPKAPKGTVVHGFIDVDTFDLSTASGDELVQIPYTYKVG